MLTGKKTMENEKASLFELVQEAYKNRRTGLVRRAHRGVESERYFIVKGELYLPRDHPLSLSIERQLLGKTAKASASGAYETQPVDTGNVPRAVLESGLRILVEILADERSIGFEYERGAAEIPMNVVGPLPTAELLMEASVRGLDEFDLLRRLGGEDGTWTARRDELLESGPDIDPQQAFFLSRAVNPISVRELLRQAEIERPLGLAKLVRLAAVGLIESGTGSRTPAREARGDLRPQDGVIQRLEERVGQELLRRPLDLDPEEHRSKILEYLGSFGEQNFYDLLGVEPQSSGEEIHAAYSDRARITHPAHAEPLGLKGGGAPLRVLFETLTDAYLTLSDADRRRSYQMKLGRDFNEALTGVSEEKRAAERVEQASRNYSIAVTMVGREDFHSAIELLDLAVKNDPKAEYFSLLADCQSRNPHWLSRAMENYQRALDLNGESIEARKGLAKVMDAAGMKDGAKEQLKLLKTIDEEAAAEVSEAVQEGEKSEKPSARKILGRLFSSLRGGSEETPEPKPPA